MSSRLHQTERLEVLSELEEMIRFKRAENKNNPTKNAGPAIVKPKATIQAALRVNKATLIQVSRFIPKNENWLLALVISS